MKTKLLIEIESPDYMKDLLLEEGDDSDEYTPEQKIEVEKLRKELAAELHNRLVNMIKNFGNEFIEEWFFDNADDLSVEGWESFEDYGVEIKVTNI